MFISPRLPSLKAFTIVVLLLGCSAARADFVLNLGPNFDVRVTGKDDFAAQRTTYEMVITNFTNTTYDCTGSIGYYRVDTGSTVQGTSGQGAAPPGGPWKIVGSTVAFSEKLATGYEYLDASCTPRTNGGGGGGTGGGGGGSSTTVKFGPGALGYSFNQQGNSVELQVKQVVNPNTSAASGTVKLEMWAFKTPYNGTAQTGTLMASSRLPDQCVDISGQLAAGAACNDILIPAAPLTLPAPGTYTTSFVLQQKIGGCGTADSYCVVSYHTFKTNGLTIDPTNTVPPTPKGLSLTGPITFSLSGSTGSFTVAKLTNNSTTAATNLLQLELWLTAQPYTGGSFSGYKMLATALPGSCPAQLMPGQSCSQISYSSALLKSPPDGTYYVTLFVTQQSPNCTTVDGYCVSTSQALGTITKTAPVQPDPDGGGNDAGSGGGGGGSFDALLLAALLLIMGIRISKHPRVRAHDGSSHLGS